MNFILFSILGLIPALILCGYIYFKDRVEKEPISLLALLFIAGALSYIPAFFAENFIISLFDTTFSSQINYSLTGVASYVSKGAEIGHSLTRSFIGIAIIEEIVKWLVLLLITKNNKNFDSFFDGIVYSVFVALGFTATENIRYALVDGWDTLLLRSITIAPAHIIFCVIMGFFYTMWHSYSLAKKKEKALADENIISVAKPFHSKSFVILSISVPVILHGIYSFIQFFSSGIMTFVFYLFTLTLYIICFVIITRMSKAASSDKKTVERLILQKYPYLKYKNIEL